MKKLNIEPLISVIAIVISIFALHTSWKSNSISEKAFEQSNKQFIATNKPQITINHSKRDPNDFICSIKGSKFHFKVAFVLKNVGNVTACNIRIPYTKKSDPC